MQLHNLRFNALQIFPAFFPRTFFLAYGPPRVSTFISPVHYLFRTSSFLPTSKLTLGILRESKTVWERRVPILPEHVPLLIKDGARILVQPSSHRAIPDILFQRAGAVITDDLSAADIIIGIKEVPSAMLLPNKTYLFFSHTHKGQPANMAMLKEILNKKITLLDYELITDANGKRKVAFGKFAGYAGMIDGFHSLGRRMLGLGFSSPFLQVAMAHAYPSLHHARKSLEILGHQIKKEGLPACFAPFVVTFTGNGNVTSGAMSIFKHFPHEFIAAADLPALFQQTSPNPHLLYAVHAKHKDYLSRSHATFKESEYRREPHAFHSEFHKKLAPYTSMLVTGHFWNVNYPRLLTTAQAKALSHGWKKKHRMLTIADISCDLEGGIEILQRPTTFEKPFVIFDPASKKYHNNVAGNGIQLMAIDILPSELPIESSTYFSEALLPFLKPLVRGTITPEIKRAMIAFKGKLEPQHQWLEKKISTTRLTESQKHVVILGSGYVVAPALDYLLRMPNLRITIASNNVEEATKLLHGRDANRISIQQFDMARTPSDTCRALLRRADVVVSLLPAPLHPALAETCIGLGKPMVTASYVSPAMRALDAAARRADVLLMNEIGLDPGLDHLSARRFIDGVVSRGGRVSGYASWCGGLPAPEHSDNPLGYKFSWSPLGAIKAALNPARFLQAGRTVEIPPGAVLKHATPFTKFKGFALQAIPNRDAVAYQALYGLAEPVHTLFRGTLRYPPYAAILEAWIDLGLMSEEPVSPPMSWPELLCQVGHVQRVQDLQVPKEVFEAMTWLGMFDPSKSVRGPTVLASLCDLLQAKLVYEKGERDMVLMYHEFTATTQLGKELRATSSLCVYGDPNGYSAMAKTVGLPVGIAVRLILEGKIIERGVVVPFHKDIYEPMLELLAQEGIVFTEKEHYLSSPSP